MGFQGSCRKIVSGWDADIYEWPWIAALMNNGRQFCGGSLIDNKHILTAAHCVAHMSRYDVANLKVRLGEYKIKHRERPTCSSPRQPESSDTRDSASRLCTLTLQSSAWRTPCLRPSPRSTPCVCPLDTRNTPVKLRPSLAGDL